MSLPSMVRDAFVRALEDAGHDTGVMQHADKPLERHLDDWHKSLLSRGRTEKHAITSHNMARRLLVETCGFKRLRDLRAAHAQAEVADLVQGHRTRNAYLESCRTFGRWLVRAGRIQSNPLPILDRWNVATDVRYERRALDADELERLIDATERGPTWERLGGPARGMLYRVAVNTGFRIRELASLTPASFTLDADPPSITLLAEYAKNRKEAHQPIRNDLADALDGWLADKPAGAPVFAMPDKPAEALRFDLRRARARWLTETQDRAERRRRRASDFLRGDEDSSGRVVGFHSLRSSFITLLVRGGASVKVAQTLARHSDPKLTMNVYTKLGIHDLTGALDALPSLNPQAPERELARAVGTYDHRPHARTDDRESRAAAQALPLALKLAERGSERVAVGTGQSDGQGSEEIAQAVAVERVTHRLAPLGTDKSRRNRERGAMVITQRGMRKLSALRDGIPVPKKAPPHCCPISQPHYCDALLRKARFRIANEAHELLV